MFIFTLYLLYEFYFNALHLPCLFTYPYAFHSHVHIHTPFFLSLVHTYHFFFPLLIFFSFPLTFFTCQVQMHSPSSTSLIILSQSLKSTKSTQVTKSIIMLCCQYKFPVQYDTCNFRFLKAIYIDVCHHVPKEATFQFHQCSQVP